DYEDPMTFLELYTSDNPTNTFGIADEEYDEMIEKADQMGDQPEKRWELLQKAEKYLIENALIIPTTQSVAVVLLNDYVEGFVNQMSGTHEFIRHAEIKEH